MTTIFQVLEAASEAKGEKLDCAVKAVAVACGYEKDYDGIHYAFGLFGRRYRHTTPHEVTTNVVKALDHKMVDVTRQFTARTVLTLGRQLRNKFRRKFLVFTRGHVLAATNGVVHDWTAGRRHRIQKVYEVIER